MGMHQRTGSFGRLVRLVTGGGMSIWGILIAVQQSGLFLLKVGIVLTLLFVFYLFFHYAIHSWFREINRWVGAILANSVVIIVFTLGISDIPIFGNGAGQLAVILYVGLSLLLAGIKADPGCEVMTVPNLVFKSNTHLACLVFSPLDWLEEKISKDR